MTGRELRRIRLRLGLSQAALAKEFGVARNTVSRWERGESNIGRLVALGITTALAEHRKPKRR